MTPLKSSEFSVKVGFILSHYSLRNACLSHSVLCCICILTLLISTVPVIKSFCRHFPAEQDHRPPSQWTLICFGVYLTTIRSTVLAKSENPWSNHLTLSWTFKSEQPAFRSLGMILSSKKQTNQQINMHTYSWQYICIFYYGFTILTALTEILRVKSLKEAEISHISMWFYSRMYSDWLVIFISKYLSEPSTLFLKTNIGKINFNATYVFKTMYDNNTTIIDSNM